MSEAMRYPELSDELKARGFGAILRIFGPGAIIASVTIGSGETVFASRGGAVFGYAMLWCFVGGGLMKFVQVYTAARYITLTGEHPIERWKYLPGPQGWAVWLLAIMTVLCFPLWLSGLPKMLGGLTVWILGFEGLDIWGDARVWGTAFVVLAIAITMIQSYGSLEKFQTIVVSVLLLSILTAAAASQPDWLAVLMGTIVPKIPAYEPWLVSKYPAVAARSAIVEMGVYLGAIGGGTQDYFGYIGMLREKAWGLMGRKVEDTADGVEIAADTANVNLGKAWLRAPMIDSSVSFACVVIFTMAFVILGAAVLRPQHIVPEGMQLLSVQADFLVRMHPALVYLYQFGVFTAFFGTIMAAYELYARTAHECFRPIVRRVREASVDSLRPWVVGYCGIGGVAIMWMGGNPVTIVTPAAIFGGVLTCGLWCLLMVWTDRRFLPEPLRMGWPLVCLNLLSGLFLTGWGIRSAIDFFAG
jgi:Mn2+/Fe2+ NRAMP family transporter